MTGNRLWFSLPLAVRRAWVMRLLAGKAQHRKSVG
jgi:hypothetical protein